MVKTKTHGVNKMDNAVLKYQKRRDARIKKRMDDFEENKHKRDENGRFVSGGGSSEPKGEKWAKDLKGKTGKERNQVLRKLAIEDYDSKDKKC